MKSTRPARKVQNTDATGSPDQGESVFILIGKIHRPHGVDGEILANSFSDSPERFDPGRTVWIGEDHKPYIIQSRRMTDRSLLIHFEGLDTPEDVGTLRNKLVYIKQSALPPLPEGEYYHFQLIGLTVLDENGTTLGVLNEVLNTGANDVYLVVDEAGNEILLPAIVSVILKTDLENKQMIVRPQEWI